MMKGNQENFTLLAEDLLRRGHSIRFQAHGHSMQPEILHGDIVTVAPVVHPLADREIVLYLTKGGRPILHRIIQSQEDPVGRSLYLICGDAHSTADGWLSSERILGRIVAVERRGQIKRLSLFNKLARTARKIRCRLRIGGCK